MSFLSPIWLFAMLPWAGVVWAVLPGRGTPAVVPALFLWKDTTIRPRVRGRRVPALPVVLLLLAALLAIFAAAGPRVVASAAVTENLSIILDRGASMAVSASTEKPFRGVLQRCADRLGSLPRDVQVTLIPVPGQPIISPGDQWLTTAEQFSPTVIPTNLDQAIDNQLRTTQGPVVVLSDQKIDRPNPRVIQIIPERAGDSVDITRLTARSVPHAQAMVRIENHSDRSDIQLVVSSGNEKIEREVNLPPRGKSVDTFIDLNQPWPFITAKLTGETGYWSQAFAAPVGTGVLITTDSQLDESVRRIAGIYSAHRAATADAPAVRITARPLGEDESGIWVQSGAGGGIAATPAVVADESTRGVQRWPAVGSATIPAGFSPIVSVASGIIVAVREQPRRAVWINAQLWDWEKTDDFVIFFATALDWLAGDQPAFAASAPAELGAGWKPAGGTGLLTQPGEWPGMYRSESSQDLIAVNAGSYPAVDQAADSPSLGALGDGFGFHPVAQWFALAALLCCVAAMGLYARSARPARSAYHSAAGVLPDVSRSHLD
jgi:hypothetical protein